MINKRQAKKYCREEISKIENYDKAIADTTQTWACHHRDEVKILPSGIEVRRSIEELKENGRYYNCPANELIFLTKAEHNRLHHKGNHEYHRKISESQKGNKYTRGKPNSEFGRKFKERYGKTKLDDVKLYDREKHWFHSHNKTCRWEVEDANK